MSLLQQLLPTFAATPALPIFIGPIATLRQLLIISKVLVSPRGGGGLLDFPTGDLLACCMCRMNFTRIALISQARHDYSKLCKVSRDDQLAGLIDNPEYADVEFLVGDAARPSTRPRSSL